MVYGRNKPIGAEPDHFKDQVARRVTADRTSQVELWLKAVQDGDPNAYEWLIESATKRVRHLTRQMLRFDRLRRWEDSDDVLQQAMLRLQTALRQVKPATAREFFALAGLQIRRTMLDLGRHYYGPHGMATHHESPPVGGFTGEHEMHHADSLYLTPQTLAIRRERWDALYAAIEKLPDDEREAVDLVWFNGLTQQQAADVLDVSSRTIGRWWQQARIKLNDLLDDESSSDTS